MLSVEKLLSTYLFLPPGQPDCNEHGNCIRSTEHDASICFCDPGFAGDDCSQYVCPGPADNLCNGNGKFSITIISSEIYCYM